MDIQTALTTVSDALYGLRSAVAALPARANGAADREEAHAALDRIGDEIDTLVRSLRYGFEVTL